MAENQEKETEMTDEEIAELANKEIKARDAEIAKLKKELNKAKLYSQAPEEEEVSLTKKECLEVISNPHSLNYDYAEAVCRLVDIELAEGNPNPLGQDGEDVYNFFKDVIEECDGDKDRFTALYQLKLAPDDAQIAAAYKRRQQQYKH